MFGQSGFGGLSTEDSTNAAAGPSVTQVDGDETDADVSYRNEWSVRWLTSSGYSLPRPMGRFMFVYRRG